MPTILKTLSVQKCGHLAMPVWVMPDLRVRTRDEGLREQYEDGVVVVIVPRGERVVGMEDQ
jgi:hypothetical protein